MKKNLLITKQEAKELSIKKWEWIIKNNGVSCSDEMLKDIPELSKLGIECQYCGYCFLFRKVIFHNLFCTKCPLRIGGGIYCMNEGHPYLEWYRRETLENAEKVLELIKNT